MKFKASLIVAASLILSAAVGTAVNAQSGKEQIKEFITPAACPIGHPKYPNC
jgi:hypothetical protein